MLVCFSNLLLYTAEYYMTIPQLIHYSTKEKLFPVFLSVMTCICISLGWISSELFGWKIRSIFNFVRNFQAVSKWSYHSTHSPAIRDIQFSVLTDLCVVNLFNLSNMSVRGMIFHCSFNLHLHSDVEHLCMLIGYLFLFFLLICSSLFIFYQVVFIIDLKEFFEE